MPKHRLFLSYKRGTDTTPAVERLDRRVKVQLSGHGVEAFFDKRSIDSGEQWLPAINDFMATATHFVAFVSIDFWLSPQCRRELALAVQGFESRREPRLFFVLADQLDPMDLILDEEPALTSSKPAAFTSEARESLASVREITRLGQINFLGPYDDVSGKLVSLQLDDRVTLDKQLNQLVETIKRNLSGLP